jgi:hypothetical protein
MAHTMHRVVRDTWNIDWNIVAQVDPEYAEKYLVNLNGSSRSTRYVPDDFTPRTRRNVHMNAQMPLGGKIQTEEELEIIRQVNAMDTDMEDVDPILGEPIPAQVNNPAPPAPVEPNLQTMLAELRNLRDQIEDVQNNPDRIPGDEDNPIDDDDIFGIGQMSQECDLEGSIHRKEAPPDWDLREIHGFNNYAGVGDPGVPLLPIPKRYLDRGSTIHLSDHLVYSIQFIDRANDPNVVGLRKQRLYIDEERVRYVTGTYYFDRVKNFVSDRKKDLNFITFSEKTKGIYWTRWIKSKPSDKRFTKRVSRLGMRVEGLQNALGRLPANMVRQFATEVVKRAKRDLGDIYFPDPNGILDMSKPNYTYSESGPYRLWISYVLAGIVWQYKGKRPLQWVENRVFMDNLSHVLSPQTQSIITQLVDPIHSAMEDAEPKIAQTYRNRLLRNVQKAVETSDSPRAILKPLFHGFYTDIHYRILSKYVADKIGDAAVGLVSIEAAIQANTAPKSAHHLLTKVFNTVDEDSWPHLKNLFSGFRYYTNVRNSPDKHMFGKWIKFNDRLFDDGHTPMNWSHFEDTMRMAAQFGHRVRINKYNTAQDLMRLHNRLSDYTTRDSRMVRSYPIFFPFAHPDKEYNGFKFVHLDTADKLVEEGTQMRHCVGGYADRCFDGTSIIFAMQKDRSWVTIELDGADQDYRIKQKYTIGDFTVENGKIKDAIAKWHRDLINMHDHDPIRYSDKAQFIASIVDCRRRIDMWKDENDPTLEGIEIAKDQRVHLEKLLEDCDIFGLTKDEATAHVEKIEQSAALKEQ